MENTRISITVNKETQQQAQQLFNDLGLDIATAVNIFLKQSVREQCIPFAVSKDVPNRETIAAIEEVKQMKLDPKLGKSYDDVDDMMKELLKGRPSGSMSLS